MLWLAVIGNSTALTPELLGLCDHLLPIIEMSSENLRTVLQLIHAYILLDAHVKSIYSPYRVSIEYRH